MASYLLHDVHVFTGPSNYTLTVQILPFNQEKQTMRQN